VVLVRDARVDCGKRQDHEDKAVQKVKALDEAENFVRRHPSWS
jgi:hypothetical protein